MSQIEFEIPEGYVLDKEASTDSKLVYKKLNDLPRSWEEFCGKKKYTRYYCILPNSTIEENEVKQPLYPHTTYDKNIIFTKDRAESILALMQLLNLKDEYKKQDKVSAKFAYYSIVYGEKADGLIVLETTNPTLFSFLDENLAMEFLNNFRDLLTDALEFIPYYN